ncbi:MAG TPA: DegV family protein [Microlunatus sp.]
MGGVVVVTDSTASLAPGQAREAGIEIIALQVVLDGVSTPEGAPGATGADVAAALRAGRRVTTSRPSPDVFATCYREAAEQGAEAVVSVHLSGGISGTCDAALLASRSAPLPVTVVDSRTVAMALGYAALSGAEAAAAGATPLLVAERIRERAGRSLAYFYVPTLEHLRRGGRIGAAQALLGSALAVKPLLTVADGVIRPYERVRTAAKALSRLEDLAVTGGAEAARDGEVEFAVHHLDDAEAATALGQRLIARMANAGQPRPHLVVAEMSAVLGVHVGPGTLGVVVSSRI